MADQPKRESKPFYKSAVVKSLAVGVGILAGIATLLNFIGSARWSDPPVGRYVQFLVDASSSMMDLNFEGQTKWTEAKNVLKYVLVNEVGDTDYLSVRTFGGSCSELRKDKRGTSLVLPFKSRSRVEAYQVLDNVTLGGESTLEAGIVELTEDFSEYERLETVDRRVLAILGSANTCSQEPVKVITNRLKSRYDLEVVFIAYGFTDAEKSRIIEFREAGFLRDLRFADSPAELRDTVGEVLRNWSDLQMSLGPLGRTSKPAAESPALSNYPESAEHRRGEAIATEAGQAGPSKDPGRTSASEEAQTTVIQLLSQTQKCDVGVVEVNGEPLFDGETVSVRYRRDTNGKEGLVRWLCGTDSRLAYVLPLGRTVAVTHNYSNNEVGFTSSEIVAKNVSVQLRTLGEAIDDWPGYSACSGFGLARLKMGVESLHRDFRFHRRILETSHRISVDEYQTIRNFVSNTELFDRCVDTDTALRVYLPFLVERYESRR